MACGRVRSSRSSLASFDQNPLLSMCGCTGAAILIVRKAAKVKILREQLHSPLVPWWISISGSCTSESPRHRRTCSETGATPLRPNNHWKREIRPRLNQIGLGWVNFQVLRRTNASLSRKANVDDKVSADQRGHGLLLETAIPRQAQRNEWSKGNKSVNCGFFYVVGKMERETRIELATNSLEGCDSTIELLPRSFNVSVS
jgi:hypothetical protein